MAQVHYKVKRIDFMKRRVPIMMQNENGPCPLLALANVMLLRNNISLPLNTDSVSQERLISLVAGRMLDANSETRLAAMPPEHAASLQQNLSDAISHLPKLTTGVDVNPKFASIGAFEFTKDIAIFDLLDIRLVHGWLVDPQDAQSAGAIGNMSYNELISALVALTGSDAVLKNSPAVLAKSSIEQRTPSLTKSQQGSQMDPDDAIELDIALRMSMGGENAALASPLSVTKKHNSQPTASGQAQTGMQDESMSHSNLNLEHEPSQEQPHTGRNDGFESSAAKHDIAAEQSIQPLQKEEQAEPGNDMNPFKREGVASLENDRLASEATAAVNQRSLEESDIEKALHLSQESTVDAHLANIGKNEEEQQLQEAIRLSQSDFENDQRAQYQSATSQMPNLHQRGSVSAEETSKNLPKDLSESLQTLSIDQIDNQERQVNGTPDVGNQKQSVCKEEKEGASLAQVSLPSLASLKKGSQQEIAEKSPSIHGSEFVNPVFGSQSFESVPQDKKKVPSTVESEALKHADNSGNASENLSSEKLVTATSPADIAHKTSEQIDNSLHPDLDAKNASISLSEFSDQKSREEAQASHSEWVEVQNPEEPSSSGFAEEARLNRLQASGRDACEQPDVSELAKLDSTTLAKGKMTAYPSPQQTQGNHGNEDLLSGEHDSTKEPETELSSQQCVEDLRRADLIRCFLEQHSSQLTEYGVISLHQGLRANELSILFRNNHFTTVFFHNGSIWMLATDQGFLYEQDIVWERLADVGGNNEFVGSTFQSFQSHRSGLGSGQPETGASQESDMALAIQLQEEENTRQQLFLQSQQQQNAPRQGNERQQPSSQNIPSTQNQNAQKPPPQPRPEPRSVALKPSNERQRRAQARKAKDDKSCVLM